MENGSKFVLNTNLITIAVLLLVGSLEQKPVSSDGSSLSRFVCKLTM